MWHQHRLRAMTQHSIGFTSHDPYDHRRLRQYMHVSLSISHSLALGHPAYRGKGGGGPWSAMVVPVSVTCTAVMAGQTMSRFTTRPPAALQPRKRDNSVRQSIYPCLWSISLPDRRAPALRTSSRGIVCHMNILLVYRGAGPTPIDCPRLTRAGHR